MPAQSMILPLTIVIDQHYNVIYVGNGPPPSDTTRSYHTMINGTLAHKLYVALAGHCWDAYPSLATQEQAIEARQQIWENRLAGALIVQRALRKWGEIIKPWFGRVKIEGDHPVVDDTDYDQTIKLKPELVA